MRYALIKDGTVINLVELHDDWPDCEPKYQWAVPEGCSVVKAPFPERYPNPEAPHKMALDDDFVEVGARFDGKEFKKRKA